MDPVDEVITKISKTKKYGSIYRPTVERIVQEVYSNYPAKQLEKVTKRKLHQIWGAYFTRPDFKKLLSKVKDNLGADVEIEEVFRELLMLQTSTKERLSFIDTYYKRIFEITGVPKKILEYGCGINALTYFWMDRGAEYHGFDVDEELIDFINNIYKLAGLDSKAKVSLGDVLIDEYEEADIYLFLKVLTIFEHQQKGSSLKILKKVPCKWIVVSFPTKSLTGKDRGMKDFYRKFFQSLISGEDWNSEEILFDNEIVFVVEK